MGQRKVVLLLPNEEVNQQESEEVGGEKDGGVRILPSFWLAQIHGGDI